MDIQPLIQPRTRSGVTNFTELLSAAVQDLSKFEDLRTFIERDRKGAAIFWKTFDTFEILLCRKEKWIKNLTDVETVIKAYCYAVENAQRWDNERDWSSLTKNIFEIVLSTEQDTEYFLCLLLEKRAREVCEKFSRVWEFVVVNTLKWLSLGRGSYNNYDQALKFFEIILWSNRECLNENFKTSIAKEVIDFSNLITKREDYGIQVSVLSILRDLWSFPTIERLFPSLPTTITLNFKHLSCDQLIVGKRDFLNIINSQQFQGVHSVYFSNFNCGGVCIIKNGGWLTMNYLSQTFKIYSDDDQLLLTIPFNMIIGSDSKSDENCLYFYMATRNIKMLGETFKIENIDGIAPLLRNSVESVSWLVVLVKELSQCQKLQTQDSSSSSKMNHSLIGTNNDQTLTCQSNELLPSSAGEPVTAEANNKRDNNYDPCSSTLQNSTSIDIFTNKTSIWESNEIVKSFPDLANKKGNTNCEPSSMPSQSPSSFDFLTGLLPKTNPRVAPSQKHFSSNATHPTNCAMNERVDTALVNNITEPLQEEDSEIMFLGSFRTNPCDNTCTAPFPIKAEKDLIQIAPENSTPDEIGEAQPLYNYLHENPESPLRNVVNIYCEPIRFGNTATEMAVSPNFDHDETEINLNVFHNEPPLVDDDVDDTNEANHSNGNIMENSESPLRNDVNTHCELICVLPLGNRTAEMPLCPSFDHDERETNLNVIPNEPPKDISSQQLGGKNTNEAYHSKGNIMDKRLISNVRKLHHVNKTHRPTITENISLEPGDDLAAMQTDNKCDHNDQTCFTPLSMDMTCSEEMVQNDADKSSSFHEEPTVGNLANKCTELDDPNFRNGIPSGSNPHEAVFAKTNGFDSSSTFIQSSASDSVPECKGKTIEERNTTKRKKINSPEYKIADTSSAQDVETINPSPKWSSRYRIFTTKNEQARVSPNLSLLSVYDIPDDIDESAVNNDHITSTTETKGKKKSRQMRQKKGKFRKPSVPSVVSTNSPLCYENISDTSPTNQKIWHIQRIESSTILKCSDTLDNFKRQVRLLEREALNRIENICLDGASELNSVVTKFLDLTLASEAALKRSVASLKDQLYQLQSSGNVADLASIQKEITAKENELCAIQDTMNDLLRENMDTVISRIQDNVGHFKAEITSCNGK